MDNIIYEIIDIFKPTERVRNILFNHLKQIEYDHEYISRFTGKPINKLTIIKNLFGDIKNSDIEQFLIHPKVILEAYTIQLHDYMASLFKDGDPITEGEEWKPCNHCRTLFASQGGLDLHIKYDKCIK